jgi:pimeloyl-ACP methyl ester carboxylesterase
MKVTSFRLTTDEGLPIRGDLHTPDSAGPVIVCVHGFKGFKDWGFWPETARRLCDAGFGVVRFNFSHSGIGEDLQNFTEPALFETGTYTREVQDLRLVLKALARGEIDPAGDLDTARPGLIGHSRGAVSVLAVAASEPVGPLVLWNPVSSLVWWDKETRRRWRETGTWQTVNKRTGQTFAVTTGLLDDAENNRDALHPVANAGRIQTPLLVVVAADDESVPPEAGRRLARAAPAGRGSLRELPGTGHTFGAAHPWQETPAAFEAALAATLEHFDRTLAKSGA